MPAETAGRKAGGFCSGSVVFYAHERFALWYQDEDAGEPLVNLADERGDYVGGQILLSADGNYAVAITGKGEEERVTLFDGTLKRSRVIWEGWSYDRRWSG
jgi:hypothetical protein